MRELLIGSNSVNFEAGHLATCEYKVLIEETNDIIPCESYGVKVTILETGESETVSNISKDADWIQKLGELLCRNGVTPTTLYDSVYDMMVDRLWPLDE